MKLPKILPSAPFLHLIFVPKLAYRYLAISHLEFALCTNSAGCGL